MAAGPLEYPTFRADRSPVNRPDPDLEVRRQLWLRIMQDMFKKEDK